MGEQVPPASSCGARAQSTSQIIETSESECESSEDELAALKLKLSWIVLNTEKIHSVS